jgi:small subunit ribosomal protein S16
MVRIRLRRVGLRNQPSYRIVVADKEAPRDGRFLEIVGFYNPRTEPATIEFHEDRVYDWLSKGAQPSEPIIRLFKVVGLMDRFNRYKAGESIEKILADAKAFYDARPVNPRTRRDAAVVKPAKKKAKEDKVEATPKGAPGGEEEKAAPETEVKAEATPVAKEEIAAPAPTPKAEGEAKPEKAPKGTPKGEAKAEKVEKAAVAQTETVVEAVAEPVEATAPAGEVEAAVETVATEKVETENVETSAPDGEGAPGGEEVKAKS